jgi:Protein of unknown function (DUF642)/Dockerin type I domain
MKHAAFLVGMAIVGCEAAAQEILINGSFEGLSNSPDCYSDNPSTGSNMIPGWVVVGPYNVDWVSSSAACTTPCPKDGLRYIDLNGSGSPQAPASAVAQAVQLVPGARYEFSVYAVSNDYQSQLGGTKILRVRIADVLTDFVLTTEQVPMGCPLPLWQKHVVRFTATVATNQVELRSMFDNNAGGIFVDCASLIELACPADVDRSGNADGIDLAIVLQNWGIPSANYPEADVNRDGLVDGSDLAIVLAGWGACP